MSHTRRLTTNDMADLLGISAVRVLQLARARKVGRFEAGRWAFAPEDLGLLSVRIPGRPRKHREETHDA